MARRVLIAEFMHETNTFSVQLTDEAVFRHHGVFRDNEVPAAFQGTRTSMGAAFEAAEKFGWSLVHPLVTGANPSGRVTDAAFDVFAGMILSACERLDGVLLHLHGAMNVYGMDDAEGDWIAAARAVVGPDCLISASFDLHGNISQRIIDTLDMLTTYRTAPHVDTLETQERALRMLVRALEEDVRPKMAWMPSPRTRP